MISLEQVQLLEAKVAKTIEYLKRLSIDNTALISEKAFLHDKLEASQKRLDELEMLVMRFKEDQGRIEDGIISALDRLNQFEEAFESGLKEKTLNSAKSNPNNVKKPVKETVNPKTSAGSERPVKEKREFFEISGKDVPKKNNEEDDVLSSELMGEDTDGAAPAGKENNSTKDGELDIF